MASSVLLALPIIEFPGSFAFGNNRNMKNRTFLIAPGNFVRHGLDGMDGMDLNLVGLEKITFVFCCELKIRRTSKNTEKKYSLENSFLIFQLWAISQFRRHVKEVKWLWCIWNLKVQSSSTSSRAKTF